MSTTSKKQFKRTRKLYIVCGLTAVAGVIFILMSPQSVDFAARYVMTISFVVIMAVDVLYALCLGRPDYDIEIEVNEAMITFRMSENDIRKLVRYGLTVNRYSKDKRYMIVRDNHQSMIIPYHRDIQKFIEKFAY